MSEYWVSRNSERYGPYTLDQLLEYYKTGQVQPTDHVCRPGTQEWVIASSMPELVGKAPPEPPATSVAPTGSVPTMSLAGPILVTLFCCLPFGIVSIVYTSQIQSKIAGNDPAGALRSQQLATTWMWWGFGIGIFANAGYVALMVAGNQ